MRPVGAILDELAVLAGDIEEAEAALNEARGRRTALWAEARAHKQPPTTGELARASRVSTSYIVRQFRPNE